jgi:hypothetical protein
MLIAVVAFVVASVTIPFWGMGPAVFLDSSRTVISRIPSPDRLRSAQVERVIVGGVPSIVVMVRSWWLPDWYLVGCAAASHYEDARAQVRWTSNRAIAVTHSDKRLYWNIGSAPFHNQPCESISVALIDEP